MSTLLKTPEAYAFAANVCTAAYPREAVILVTASGLVEVENVADDPYTTFEVDSSAVQRAMLEDGGLLGVIHSHPDGNPYPSEADMRSQVSAGVPYGIFVSTPGGSGDYIEFGGDMPALYERPFRHGVTDCYEFIRAYYRTHFDIELRAFPRGWEWWENGATLYVDYFPRAGFYEVPASNIQPGDLLLIAFRGDTPTHAAVYAGDGMLAHHLAGQKAYDPVRVPLREPASRWMPHVTHVLRHEELKDAND